MEKMVADFKTHLAILDFNFFLLDPDSKKLLRMGGSFLLFQKPPKLCLKMV
tara:strand:- start:653 stop:805 length:153 start_codon:yes stop_codon:yes gene_type:complete